MFWYYSEEEVAPQTDKSASPLLRRSRQAHQVLLASNGFALLILVISATILHYFPQASQTWADILGVSLAVGACFQWLPQIVTTWRLGHLGSLSPTSLFFLVPYTWIFGISMIVRVGIKGWSAWIIYVLVGTMQLILIGFAIVFSSRSSVQEVEYDSKSNLPLEAHKEMTQTSSESHIDESCPLLQPKRPIL